MSRVILVLLGWLGMAPIGNAFAVNINGPPSRTTLDRHLVNINVTVECNTEHTMANGVLLRLSRKDGRRSDGDCGKMLWCDFELHWKAGESDGVETPPTT